MSAMHVMPDGELVENPDHRPVTHAPKGTFGHRCETCGEHNATKVCLVCLAAETGATVTVGARGTVVTMPNAIRVLH